MWSLTLKILLLPQRYTHSLPILTVTISFSIIHSLFSYHLCLHFFISHIFYFFFWIQIAFSIDFIFYYVFVLIDQVWLCGTFLGSFTQHFIWVMDDWRESINIQVSIFGFFFRLLFYFLFCPLFLMIQIYDSFFFLFVFVV